MRFSVIVSACAILVAATASSAAFGKPGPLLVVDGHNDLFIHYMDCKGCPRSLDDYDIAKQTPGDTDIPRLRAGGVSAVLLNVFSTNDSTRDTLAAFDYLRDLEWKYADDVEVAATAEDVRRIHAAGRIAIVPMMEGANRLANSPMMVRTLYRLGLRAVTLAYDTNDLADGSDDVARHNGLSPLGRTIVEEMNRTGVLIDLSHVSTETMNDVLDISAAPVIFSHSSARALVDVPRNVPDDVLRRVAKNGGVVMVSFVPYFSSQANADWSVAMRKESDLIAADYEAKRLTDAQADARWAAWQRANPEPVATIADVADHIDHVRRIAGADHVGLGSDFDGIEKKVSGLEDVSTFPSLIAELRRRGWSYHDLKKLAGENFLRVMEEAQATAERMRKEAKP
ncbi:MAG: dipeptidase [Parvularculaceae bacterium]